MRFVWIRNLQVAWKRLLYQGIVTPPTPSLVAAVVYPLTALCVLPTLYGTLFPPTVAKIPPVKNSFQLAKVENFSQQPVLTRNLFNVDGLLADADTASTGRCPKTPPTSKLAYTLAGILYGGSANSSVVLFTEDSLKKQGDTTKTPVQTVYKLGDTLPQGGRVTNIFVDQIWVSMGNCPEVIALVFPTIPSQRVAQSRKGGSSGASYSEDGFERVGLRTNVTRQWVNNVLDTKLATTLQDAYAVPNIVNGQVQGFSLSKIMPDSVYAKLGLQNGDVVQSVNGIELNDAGRAIQTLGALKTEKEVNFQVLRNGQTVNFKVNIQ